MMKQNKSKTIVIPGLYSIRKEDEEKMYRTLLSAFQDYPKLLQAFPVHEIRMHALEATLRYYAAYDLRYGSGFSLDHHVWETVLLVRSEEMHYTPLRHLFAGSYSKAYRSSMKQLSKEQRKLRIALFEELDRLEKTVEIPQPHLYLDFLGTSRQHQKVGRGRKLMEQVCAYSKKIRLPIMLFTNTEADIRFYQSLGFRIIGVTTSKTFGFVNTYLLYDHH